MNKLTLIMESNSNPFAIEHKKDVIYQSMEQPSFSKKCNTIRRLFGMFTHTKKPNFLMIFLSCIRKPKHWLLLRQCFDLEKSMRYTNAMEHNLKHLFSQEEIDKSNTDVKMRELPVPDDLAKKIPKDNYQVVMAKNKVKIDKWEKAVTKPIKMKK